MDALKGLVYVSFGLQDGNRVQGVNPSADWRELDVLCDGVFYCRLHLGVVGKHNAINALAAAGAAWMLGIPGEVVARSLEDFHGAERRMQYKGSYNGADVFDDYAHHPGELAATIAAIRATNPKRLVVAFQPHTYTRTHALFADFVRELQKPDVVIVAEIYAARERNTIGISSRDLVQQIPGAIYCATLPDVTRTLRQIAQSGDVIFTIGAGDIFRAGEALLK